MTTKGNSESDTIKLYTFTLDTDGKRGFSIASGDEHIGQVYAYVEEGSVSDTTYIKGMAQMIRDIPKVCEAQLAECNDNITTKCGIDEYMKEIEGRTPYIKTAWSQSAPYNWGTPTNTCPGKSYYFAGCGAIAVAQVVAYYKSCDREFNFESLTAQKKIYTSSNPVLTDEVSRFVAYIGDLCSTIYSCEVSNTYFSSCVSVFNRFGYNNSTITGEIYLNYDKLKRCIDSNNVVFAFGVDNGGAGGHFWIIDGFLPIMTKCDATKMHCNWGWGGTSDGWYTDIVSWDKYTHPEGQPYNFTSENRYCFLSVNQ